MERIKRISMIKATDLMIGDWVNLNFDINYKTGESIYAPVQVTGINKDGTVDVNLTYDKSESMQDGWDLSLIKPIPLTSEILEKNGFKRLQDTYLFKVTTNLFGVNLWLEIGPDSWIENDKICVDSLKGDFNYPMLTVTTCKYVHEFQHLLKLCKIEKEIMGV